MKKSYAGIEISSISMIKAGFYFAVGQFGWKIICSATRILMDEHYIRLAKSGDPYGVRYCERYHLDYERYHLDYEES